MPPTVRPLILGLALLVTACSPAAVASLLPMAGPLVTVTSHGGECMDGPCGSTIVIERDGSVHQTEPTESALGRLPADLVAGLDAAIRTTDFDIVRARPFTGECPVNFDGQEWIYEFGAPSGIERIATCETEVDPDHPLFLAVEAALQAVEVIPAGG